MAVLVWSGAGVALLGIAGIAMCIVEAVRLRRAAAGEDDMRARLARLGVWNMASLAVSGLGLMIVAVGILLG